jgi:hypothetical protein
VGEGEQAQAAARSVLGGRRLDPAGERLDPGAVSRLLRWAGRSCDPGGAELERARGTVRGRRHLELRARLHLAQIGQRNPARHRRARLPGELRQPGLSEREQPRADRLACADLELDPAEAALGKHPARQLRHR